MASNPGIMFYFDDWLPLLDMDDAQLSRLFRAAILYASGGIEPELSGVDSYLFALISSKIKRDGSWYIETCRKNRYNRYRGLMKEKGITPLPFDEWTESVDARQRSSTLVNDLDQLQTQSQTQFQKQTERELQRDQREEKGETASHNFQRPYTPLSVDQESQRREEIAETLRRYGAKP